MVSQSTPALSEDHLRVLSHLVFACIPPGHSIIKLFDPVTGALEDYQLVRLPSTTRTPLVASRRPGRHATQSAKGRRMPSQAGLEAILERLEAAVLGDSPTVTILPKKNTSVPSASQQYIKSRPSARARFPPALKQPKTTLITPGINDFGSHDIPIPSGPLSQLQRALYYRNNDEGMRYTFTTLPLAFQAPSKHSMPPPVSELYPYDADASSSSPDCTPAKPLFPSSGVDHRDRQKEPSYETSGELEGSGSRLVGLGFTTILKNDGSPFDGLGPLTGGLLYHNDSSPSDEAQARAYERRVLRGAASVRSPHAATYSATRMTPVAMLSPLEVPRGRDSYVGFPDRVSTPITISTRRAPPGAPAKRVLGRSLPSLDERVPRKGRRPEREPYIYHRERPSPGVGQVPEGAYRPAGMSKSRNENCVRKKHSPPSGPAMGNQLRFWSYWMTPIHETKGESRRPAWRP